MRILDRFTRDRHSRLIWGGATAVFLVLALLALAGGRMALSDQEQESQDVAVGYTDTVLFDALDANLLEDEIRGRNYRDLIIQVQGGIMTDEGVARVRIWAPDGTLLFSTESLEQVGVAKAVNSEPIEAAVHEEVTSVISDATVEAKSGLSGTTQRLFQTYAPIRVRERTTSLGVAEIDRTYASITEAAAQPWRTLQIALAAATLLCALLLVLSLRRVTAIERIGISPPREELPSAPVPVDQNALRLRNELERERQTTRKLQAELEASGGGGLPHPPADAAAVSTAAAAAALEAEATAQAAATAQAEAAAAQAEAATAQAEAAARAAAAAQAEADARARLAEAEGALAEAGAHTAALEQELAEARSRMVAPEAVEGLEDRVRAAESRAREAEVRLRDLSAAAAAAASPLPTAGDSGRSDGSREPLPAANLAAVTAHDPEDEGVVPDPSPRAMDLRSRLARNAARKKLGHADEDGVE